VRLLVLTDRHQAQAAGRDLPSTVAAAVQAGAPTIVFREKDLPADARRELGEQVAEACGDAELIVASDPHLARALGARTVHLAQADRWPDDDELAIGMSCHDNVELAAAVDDGAAYATISPIFPSVSKPGYLPTFGLHELALLVTDASLPVIALGGVTAANAVDCLSAGAAGVAVMGAVMAAPDPAAVIGTILEAGAQA
jgi:thiamine-phosphate pyrophosphorylase